MCVLSAVRVMKRVTLEELGKLGVIIGHMFPDEQQPPAWAQHAPRFAKPLVKVGEVVQDLSAEHEINRLVTQRNAFTGADNAVDALDPAGRQRADSPNAYLGACVWIECNDVPPQSGQRKACNAVPRAHVER